MKMAAAWALPLGAAVLVVARRSQGLSNTEFALTALALALALLLALPASTRPGWGMAVALEPFATSIADTLQNTLAPSMDRLTSAFERMGQGGQKHADGGDVEGAVEEEGVDVNADRYKSDPDVKGDPERLLTMQRQYKRVQLLLCRLQGYDSGLYERVLNALASAATTATAMQSTTTPQRGNTVVMEEGEGDVPFD